MIKKIILTLISIMGLLAVLPAAFSQPKTPLSYDYARMQKDLEKYIREQMGKYHVKGLSIVLVDDQQVVWAKGFGKADEKKKIPATADTLYPVGAVSKLFTAVEILRLADAGAVSLDAPIREILPDFSIRSRFEGAPEITVRSLLAQHSGLPAFCVRGMWLDEPDSISSVVEGLKDDYMNSPPQTFFKYSYVDYVLLGRVIEVKSGKEYSQAMHDNVLEPLGMDSSTFEAAPISGEKIAKGYRENQEIPYFRLRDVPATGLVTSARDLAKFLNAIFAGGVGVLQPSTVETMFVNQFPDLPLDFGQQAGQGWMLSGIDIEGSQGTAWHDGGFPPYFSRVVVLNKQKLGMVILTNSDEAQKLLPDVTTRVLKLMLQAKYGLKANFEKLKVEMPPEVKLPPETLDKYAGFYSAFGQVTRIKRNGTNLSAELLHMNVDLVPVSENTFVPRIVVLLFFPVTLPQFPMTFSTIEGREVAVLKGLPFTVPFERIEPVPIPESWKARLGEYEVENALPEEPLQIDRVSLEILDGFLTVKMKISFKVLNFKDREFKVAIVPLSDEEALIPGFFYGDGGTLRAVEEEGTTRAYYSGYRYVKKTDMKTPVQKP
jgi:CubicO group peptidase (beta-lactamase class C family)